MSVNKNIPEFDIKTCYRKNSQKSRQKQPAQKPFARLVVDPRFRCDVEQWHQNAETADVIEHNGAEIVGGGDEKGTAEGDRDRHGAKARERGTERRFGPIVNNVKENGGDDHADIGREANKRIITVIAACE